MRHVLIGLALLLTSAAAHAAPQTFTASAVLAHHDVGLPPVSYTVDFERTFSNLIEVDFAFTWAGPGFKFGQTFRFDDPEDQFVTELADGQNTGEFSFNENFVCFSPTRCGQSSFPLQPKGILSLESVDITVFEAAVVPEPGLGGLVVLALVGTAYWRHRVGLGRRRRIS
jgi:hypothetical protein